MIIKRFSTNSILDTNSGVGLGFRKGRNYDMDMNRLGRMETAHRELSRVGDLGKEMRKLNTELNKGLRGQWEDTD